MHMMKGKWHKYCWWFGGLLWTLAALSVLLAWWAVYRRGLVLGLEPLAWYWNALVLGVLALGCKSDCGSCGSCGACGTCMPEEKGGEM